MYILAVIKMKTIIVPVYPVINSYAINIHLFATEYAKTMIGAGGKKSILHAKIIALIKDSQVRTIEITTNAMLARTRIVSFAIIKGETVPVHCSFSFNGNIMSIHSKQENDIAIARRHSLTGCIIFTFWTS